MTGAGNAARFFVVAGVLLERMAVSTTQATCALRHLRVWRGRRRLLWTGSLGLVDYWECRDMYALYEVRLRSNSVARLAWPTF
jgi:hypothetical protein